MEKTTTIKIAIIGSRGITDKDFIFEKLSDIFKEKKPSEVISGGAKGPDTIGVLWAESLGIPTVVYKPDWERYGRGAGMRRNTTIVENCDHLIAFWDGESKGTQDSIYKAKKLGKNVLVIKVQ
jgi:hypothetical protein